MWNVDFRWFDYMGDDQTPFVPFLIEYSYDSDGLDSPLEPPTKDCNEPYDVSNERAMEMFNITFTRIQNYLVELVHGLQLRRLSRVLQG